MAGGGIAPLRLRAGRGKAACCRWQLTSGHNQTGYRSQHGQPCHSTMPQPSRDRPMAQHIHHRRSPHRNNTEITQVTESNGDNHSRSTHDSGHIGRKGAAAEPEAVDTRHSPLGDRQGMNFPAHWQV
ncbi:hypothetical protein GCM10010388_42880 [Streptomyces mauvecolor]